MKRSPAHLARLVMLVLVLLTAGAFMVSFVRGLGSRADAIQTEPASTRWTTPANVEARVVGRVEVLNGAGRTGLAREATRALREAGFDVVYFGNGEATDSSVVYHRAGSIEVARAAAGALRIRNIVTREDTTLLLDATVLLGADWSPGSRR
ncbi:MAG: LytR C-terminal domain-containing protein [Gemmatimonadetes bacterium]|nr:LytR C-terminal domain-containing protein [Gemmatimonadota bacterium]